MKIMVLGDLHGNVIESVGMVRKAHNHGISHIMQLGDFGIFPAFNDFVEFLDKTNHQLRLANANMYFLDGNHDNLDYLWALMKFQPLTDRQMLRLRSNIIYTPRGCQWTWDGKRFMTVGGAVSIDKEYRLHKEKQNGPGTLWFPNEQLSDDQLDSITRHFVAGKAKPVDYMFTHDCPTNAPFRERLKPDADSQIHRQRMDELGKRVKPRYWFHGHMHTKYDDYPFPNVYEPTTRVFGLEADFDAMRGYGTRPASNWGVLDTQEDRFTWGPEYGKFEEL